MCAGAATVAACSWRGHLQPDADGTVEANSFRGSRKLQNYCKWQLKVTCHCEGRKSKCDIERAVISLVISVFIIVVRDYRFELNVDENRLIVLQKITYFWRRMYQMVRQRGLRQVVPQPGGGVYSVQAQHCQCDRWF